MIETQEFGHMEAKEFLVSRNKIVFILEGQLHVSLCNNWEGIFHNGQIVFLPAGDRVQYKALEKSKLLVFRIADSIQLCSTLSLDRLYNMVDEEEKPEGLVALEMNERLQHFSDEIMNALEDGLKCRMYFQTEIMNLLILIRAYYSSEQLRQFLTSLLSPDRLFSEQVWTNYLQCHTVNDLAASMNMSQYQFTRQFSRIFGCAPHEWIQQEKARLIYEEICGSNKPLKEIALRYGFTVQSNFNRFCQAEFTMSPGKIRKKQMEKRRG